MKLLLLGLSALASNPAAQERLTFESLPDGSPLSDGMAISDQYNVSPYFITFERVEPNGDILPATLAMIGGERTAFQGPFESHACSGPTRDDMLAPGAYEDYLDEEPGLGLGCYFLTDDGKKPSASTRSDLIVRYSVPVNAASGFLLDVDNTEHFEIYPRDENDNEIIGHRISLFGNGRPDGYAVKYSFESDTPIWSIYIDSISGTRGIAFDEFSPNTTCPELVQYYGTGVPGFQGRQPSISVDCPRVGEPLRVQVHNGRPGAHGCLFFSANGRAVPPIPYAGGLIHVIPPVSLTDVHNLDGNGSHIYVGSILDASLLGMKFQVQAAYADLDAPGGNSFTVGAEFEIAP